MKSLNRTAPAGLGLLAAVVLIPFLMPGCKKGPSPDEEAALAAEEAREDQLAWNHKTLLQAYQKVGERSAEWDEPVERALTEWARANSGMTDLKTVAPIIATNAEAAVKAGCRDPLVAYMHALFVVEKQNPDPKAVAEAFCDATVRLKNSSYPDIRKFYAQRRVVEHIYRAYGRRADWDLLVKTSGTIFQDLRRAVSDKQMPPEEAYQAVSRGLTAWRGSATEYERSFQKLDETLRKNWPHEPFVHLFKGEAYVEMAWQARGGGFARSVTPEGAKLFRERLDVAQAALLDAWKGNPRDKRVAFHMLKVARGKSLPREEMETWFQRAMKLDPNYYEACDEKRLYLSPWWHGSDAAMLKFGRACVQSRVWGGRVPLILVQTHQDLSRNDNRSERPGYWTQPEVWPDVKAAFDKFFKLNPMEHDERHNYAQHAFRCEQWDAFLQQMGQLGQTNRHFFGGQEELDAMLRLAARRAGAARSSAAK